MTARPKLTKDTRPLTFPLGFVYVAFICGLLLGGMAGWTLGHATSETLTPDSLLTQTDPPQSAVGGETIVDLLVDRLYVKVTAGLVLAESDYLQMRELGITPLSPPLSYSVQEHDIHYLYQGVGPND